MESIEPMVNNISDGDGAKNKMAGLPFDVKMDKIDLSVNVIFKEYPRDCLPNNFKTPSGPKAKRLGFESIDNLLYDPSAHMVAFRINRNRLEAWIRALGVVYYEHYGKLEESFLVDWHDEPSDWTDEGNHNKAICIGLTKDSLLLYRVTLFVTTGVIQAQGLQHDLFARNDFPLLLSLVNAICEFNASTAHEDMNIVGTAPNHEVVEIDELDADNETLVKSIPEIVPSSVISPVLEGIEENFVHSGSAPENLDQRALYMNFEQLQTSFVEALSKINQSQTALIAKVERGLSDSLKEVTKSLNNLQSQFNASKTPNNKQNSDAYMAKLQTHVTDIEKQLFQMRTEKYNSALEISRLESSLSTEKTRAYNLEQTLNTKLQDLKSDNDHLIGKLQCKSEEIDKLRDDNKSLKNKVDEQFNEILSLKTQLSSMFLPNSDGSKVERAASQEPRVMKQKPKALLIGTSNIKGVKEDKLSSDVDIKKSIAYTLDETKDVIENWSHKPDVVILHSFTNDVKSNKPEKCAEKLHDVVNSINNKWKETKIIVSMTTPREDKAVFDVNSEILDGIVKRDYLDCPYVHISENSNMRYGHLSTSELLSPEDRFHLSAKGTSLLASNIKNTLHSVLNIRRRAKNSADRANTNSSNHPRYKSWNNHSRGGNRHYRNGPNYSRDTYHY